MTGPDQGRSPWDPDPQAPPWAIRRLQLMSARTRMLIGVITVGIIVVAGVVDGMTRTPDAAATQHVSDLGPAPAFSLSSVKQPDRKVSLSEDAGHPVVLNFWGSWCGPCQEEMPLLAKTASAFGPRGRIRFIGVDLEDVHRSSAVAMMDKYKTPYPSAYDPDDTITSRFGVEGTPTTVFIDSSGDIVGRYAGALSPAVLQFWLQHLT